jgi:guanylate kinase
MTTRKPREGETDGVEYHFVSNEVFEDLVSRDGLLEHAGFVDNYYGTPRAFVEENRRR